MADRAVPVGHAAPSAAPRATLRPSYLFSRFGLHLIAILIGLTLMLPFYWAVASSLKQVQEVRQIPPVFWPKVPQWENYVVVWNVRLFTQWVANTFFLSIVPTIGILFSTSLAGYAFARFRFPGKAVL